MPEDREWSWVGEDGVVHGLGEDELTFALSSEEIPAYALVSHKTWAEWLPAMQAAELQWALPSGHADNPRKAEVLTPEGVRSPPPIAEMRALKSRFEDLRAGRVDRKSDAQAAPRVPLPSGPVPSEPVPSGPRSDELDLSDVVESEFDAVLGNLDALGDDAREEKTRVLGGGPRGKSRTPGARTPRPAPVEPPRGKLPSVSDALPPVPRAKLPSGSALGPAAPTRARFDSDVSLQSKSAPLTPRPRPVTPASPKPGSFQPGSVAPVTPRPISVAPVTPRPISISPLSPRTVSAAPRPQQKSVPPAASFDDGRSEAPAPPRGPSPSVPETPLPPIDPASTAVAFPSVAPSPVPPPPMRAPAPSAPELSRPPALSRPSLPEPVQLAPAEAAGNFKSGPRPVHFAFAAAALLVVGLGVWFTVFAKKEEPVAVVPTATAAPPPPPPKELVTTCKSSGQPKKIFDFAKPEVKPVWGEPGKDGRVPLGFSQTTRLALGLMVDAKDLTSSIITRHDDASPMYSVVPSLRAGQPELLIERAASRLQTSRAVPAAEPFAIGLRNKTIGARVDKQDRDLWPSPWEVLTVPDVARLDEKTHVLTFRAGGLRGKVLVGKVTERAEPVGDLVPLEMAAERVGEASIAVGEKQVMVAVEAGQDASLGQVFVGLADRPDLPRSAKRVTSIANPASLPGIVPLPSGGFFLQWTEGAVGKQSLHGRVFDKNLDAGGEAFTLSPGGADAYHGVSIWVGDRVVTTYFVRMPNNNHELWATALECVTE